MQATSPKSSHLVANRTNSFPFNKLSTPAPYTPSNSPPPSRIIRLLPKEYHSLIQTELNKNSSHSVILKTLLTLLHANYDHQDLKGAETFYKDYIERCRFDHVKTQTTCPLNAKKFLEDYDFTSTAIIKETENNVVSHAEKLLVEHKLTASETWQKCGLELDESKQRLTDAERKMFPIPNAIQLVRKKSFPIQTAARICKITSPEHIQFVADQVAIVLHQLIPNNENIDFEGLIVEYWGSIQEYLKSQKEEGILHLLLHWVLNRNQTIQEANQAMQEIINVKEDGFTISLSLQNPSQLEKKLIKPALKLLTNDHNKKTLRDVVVYRFGGSTWMWHELEKELIQLEFPKLKRLEKAIHEVRIRYRCSSWMREELEKMLLPYTRDQIIQDRIPIRTGIKMYDIQIIKNKKTVTNQIVDAICNLVKNSGEDVDGLITQCGLLSYPDMTAKECEQYRKYRRYIWWQTGQNTEQEAVYQYALKLILKEAYPPQEALVQAEKTYEVNLPENTLENLKQKATYDYALSLISKRFYTLPRMIAEAEQKCDAQMSADNRTKLEQEALYDYAKALILQDWSSQDAITQTERKYKIELLENTRQRLKLEIKQKPEEWLVRLAMHDETDNEATQEEDKPRSRKTSVISMLHRKFSATVITPIRKMSAPTLW